MYDWYYEGPDGQMYSTMPHITDSPGDFLAMDRESALRSASRTEGTHAIADQMAMVERIQAANASANLNAILSSTAPGAAAAMLAVALSNTRHLIGQLALAGYGSGNAPMGSAYVTIGSLQSYGSNSTITGTGVTVTLGYTNAAGHGIHGQNHALVIITDSATGRQYATRAGPSGGLGASQATAASAASASGGSVSATAGNGGSGGHGFGSIYAEHGVYDNTFRDSPAIVHTLQPVGSLDLSFSAAQARAREFATVTNNSSLPYRPLTLNSNSYAFTFVESLGFPRPRPVIGAPAWNSGRPGPNLSYVRSPTP
jgi:hypothetical protein